MSVLEYTELAARLCGASKRAARDMAVMALRRVGLSTLATRPAASLGLAERRALQLAKAIADDPRVVVAEAPLDRLEGDYAAFVLGAFAAATDGRRALVSVKRIDGSAAESALARMASHVVVLGASGVVAEGAPEELLTSARLVRVALAGQGPAMRAALAARGASIEGGPTHFLVRLPEGALPGLILEAASEARAPVIEMVPLAGL
ncbi:MAG: hypothetical protein IPK82_24230 [Polyangiaceae bacterium]|nr:hypothetical protein [Polyangiaceae bacterium]